MKFKYKKLNRKGSLADLPFIMVVLLVFAISVIVSWTIWMAWTEKFNPDTDINRNITKSVTTAVRAMDWIFIIIFVGLTLSTVILAFRIQTHPAFFFIALLMLIFMIILAGIFGDTWAELKDSGLLENATSTFTIINDFFDSFPTYMMIVGFMIMIALYAKFRISEA